MASESTAFGEIREWWSKKGSEWSTKASEIWDNLYETDEEKKEALKAFNKKVTEVADKDEKEIEYEDKTNDEQEAYDVKRFRIYEQMKAEEDKESSVLRRVGQQPHSLGVASRASCLGTGGGRLPMGLARAF